MLDLTKLDLTKGPWEVAEDYTGQEGIKVVGEYSFVRHASGWVEDAYNGHNGTKESEANTRLLAASYEMLSNTIEDTLALEPFDDGDQDNPVVRIITRNIESIEKLFGLPWAKVKQRLGV